MIGTDVARDCSTHFQRYFPKAGLTPGTVRRPSVGSRETAETGLSFSMRQLFAGDYEMIVL